MVDDDDSNLVKSIQKLDDVVSFFLCKIAACSCPCGEQNKNERSDFSSN
jgi:hypothetical protein